MIIRPRVALRIGKTGVDWHFGGDGNVDWGVHGSSQLDGQADEPSDLDSDHQTPPAQSRFEPGGGGFLGFLSFQLFSRSRLTSCSQIDWY